ncbi:MAG: glycosyltransferase family 4 protein, partial [Planctomycetes bacterium]|nr:glycosyltransferase family 4 protein [Planctomycetota bacterium]
VTTAVGGIPEVVTDGETGLVVPTRRPEELAERMLRLARDGDLRRRLGGAARERVGEFTMERMARSYEELYDGLLSGRLDRELTTEN